MYVTTPVLFYFRNESHIRKFIQCSLVPNKELSANQPKASYPQSEFPIAEVRANEGIYTSTFCRMSSMKSLDAPFFSHKYALMCLRWFVVVISNF